jgi:hypothetical protein
MRTDSESTQTEQGTMQSDSSTASLVGLALFFLPGLLFLIVEFSTKLGQSNPFIMLLLFLFGGIITLVGLMVYLIADKGLKKKILTVMGGFTFYILLIPLIWGVNGLKERIYIRAHKENLEVVANKLLTNTISIVEANEILKSQNSVLKVICVPKENKHVLFLLNGLIDNCSGFSYSLTDKEPSQNCCGDLISWKKITKKWYKWGTT